MPDGEKPYEVGTTLALLTAWRADDFDVFAEIANGAGPSDYAACIGMLNMAMCRLARHEGWEEAEYFRQFALVMAE